MDISTRALTLRCDIWNEPGYFSGKTEFSERRRNKAFGEVGSIDE